MKITTKILLASTLSLILFSGCNKTIEEYNKPAIYWYSKMIKYVSNGNLEKADNYYASLQGEHIGSPLLPEATMILAIAHMNEEEYLISEHFLDEYITRYATQNEKEYAEFLKVKAKYLSLPNPRRDQALIKEAISDANKFKSNYPNSNYFDVVNTMLSRLLIAKTSLNETIAKLYERLDKPKGATYYRKLENKKWINWDEIDKAEIPWYREWFEGDGTDSWYAFMIPDTISVVSRNSILENNTTK